MRRAIDNSHPPPSPERRHLLERLNQIDGNFPNIRPQLILRLNGIHNVERHPSGDQLAHHLSALLPWQNLPAPLRMLVNHRVQLG